MKQKKIAIMFSMNICLFKPEEVGHPLYIKDERAQHIIKVLHKKEGDTFQAGIINGKAGTAYITNMNSASIEYTFTEESEGKTLYPLSMIIGFPRPIQLKRLLRDIAALGVQSVHLTGTDLGEKSYMQSNLVEHGTAYQMLLDGTVQAASTHVPELYLHKSLNECLESIEKEFDNPLKLLLDNVKPDGSLGSVLNNHKASSYIAAIGSERGWTDRERDILKSKGFLCCSMGNRIMRTETAATVASSVIADHAGWLS